MPDAVLGWPVNIRGHLGEWKLRILDELRASIAEDHTPHQVAASFAIGTFITMMPTLGVGLLGFIVLLYLFDWINKIALFAAVLVFNPVVKWGVYLSSFSLGVLLLGPVEGMATVDISIASGPAIAYRLLVGNLILAVIATVIGYAVAYRIAAAYGDEIEDVLDTTIDELETTATTPE